MPDLETASNIVAHGAGAVTSGGLGAWLMHFFKSKQEAEERRERAKLDQDIAVTLAQLVEQVKEIRTDQAKHAGYGERIALVERDIEAFHKRLDGRPNRPKSK